MSNLDQTIAEDARYILSRICRLGESQEDASKAAKMKSTKVKSSLSSSPQAWAAVLERVEAGLINYNVAKASILAMQAAMPAEAYPGAALHRECGNWETNDRANVRALVYRELANKAVEADPGLTGHDESLVLALNVFGCFDQARAVVQAAIKGPISVADACQVIADYEAARNSYL